MHIVLLTVLAFALRVWKLPTDLLFHRDQGMVAMDIYRIWHEGKISLIGAPSDVDGIVHSPVYYWILTPFYALFRGDPVAPAIFQIFLECISLLFLYKAIRLIFNKKTALLTVIFYAISYGMISYSKWFITVPFILPLANFLMYLLAIQEKQKNSVKLMFFTSLTVGMIVQTNAAIGVFFVPFILFFYRKGINLRRIILLILGMALPALPLILFQFRHNFVTVKAVANYAFGTKSGVGLSLGIFWNNLIMFFREVNHAFLFPFYAVSTLLFIWGLFKVYKKSNYILIYSYFLIPFIFLSLFQRGAISFFFIAALPLVLAVVAYGLSSLPRVLMIILSATIMIININNLQYVYKPTNALIPIGDKNLITLQDRKNVIDWMYRKADGKNFSVWIYTIPYFQDYPWEYLFITYAQDKYGYQPEKTKSFSPNDLVSSKLFFNIYEPDEDNLSRQSTWFDEVVLNFGPASENYNSHDIFVELHPL